MTWAAVYQGVMATTGVRVTMTEPLVQWNRLKDAEKKRMTKSRLHRLPSNPRPLGPSLASHISLARNHDDENPDIEEDQGEMIRMVVRMWTSRLLSSALEMPLPLAGLPSSQRTSWQLPFPKLQASRSPRARPYYHGAPGLTSTWTYCDTRPRHIHSPPYILQPSPSNLQPGAQLAKN